jgi:hypothetical protein
VSTTAADPSAPHVMRWNNEHAGPCERDRRPRATPERHRECRTTKVDHSVAIADYIENFYNLSRRHSSLSYFTPEEFENLQFSETQASLA